MSTKVMSYLGLNVSCVVMQHIGMMLLMHMMMQSMCII